MLIDHDAKPIRSTQVRRSLDPMRPSLRVPFALKTIPYQRASDGRRYVTGLQMLQDQAVGNLVREYPEFFSYAWNADAACLTASAAKALFGDDA